MHGKAGGELIDSDQAEIRDLARELALSEHRILRRGFAHYRLGPEGLRRKRSARSGWQASARAVAPLIQSFKLKAQVVGHTLSGDRAILRGPCMNGKVAWFFVPEHLSLAEISRECRGRHNKQSRHI